MLAVLLGVVRCHEMGISESLVSHLALETTLGAFLLLLLHLTDLLLESLAFFLLLFQALVVAGAAEYAVR